MHRSAAHSANKGFTMRKSKKITSLNGKGKYKKILFTDEKMFTIEQKLNLQNDRAYARSSFEALKKILRIQRAYHPAYIMVQWGVLW